MAVLCASPPPIPFPAGPRPREWRVGRAAPGDVDASLDRVGQPLEDPAVSVVVADGRAVAGHRPVQLAGKPKSPGPL